MGTKARPKAGKGNRIKDLTPRRSKPVTGGRASKTSDIVIIKQYDKSTPVLG